MSEEKSSAGEGEQPAPPMNRAERRAAARKGGSANTNPAAKTGRPASSGPMPHGHGPGGMPPGKKAGLPRRTGKG